MTIYVEAVVSLEGNEDTLIDAVTWLLKREFSEKMKDLDFIEVRVEDAGDWVESLHRHVFHTPQWIEGSVTFSYRLAKKLNLDPKQEIGFTSELADVDGEEGVVVELHYTGKVKRYYLSLIHI